MLAPAHMRLAPVSLRYITAYKDLHRFVSLPPCVIIVFALRDGEDSAVGMKKGQAVLEHLTKVGDRGLWSAGPDHVVVLLSCLIRALVTLVTAEGLHECDRSQGDDRGIDHIVQPFFALKK